MNTFQQLKEELNRINLEYLQNTKETYPGTDFSYIQLQLRQIIKMLMQLKKEIDALTQNTRLT